MPLIAKRGPVQPDTQIDWNALKQEITSRLDMVAEYESFGVRLTKKSPSSDGWKECHAIREVGNEDDIASAAINVNSWYYTDRGSGEKGLHFFDFALKHGQFATWIDVIKHYANKANVEIKGEIEQEADGGILEKIYTYQDGDGIAQYGVHRYKLPDGKKSFRQYPLREGRWIKKKGCMQGVSPLPYGLGGLLEGQEGDAILVVEGEKDVDRAWEHGFRAISSHGGANDTDKTWLVWAQHLPPRQEYVIPDNDEAGRKHAHRKCEILYSHGRHPRYLVLPNLGQKGDLSDWFDQGGTASQLRELMQSAPAWTPETANEIEQQATGLSPVKVSNSLPATAATPTATPTPNPGYAGLSDAELGIVPLASVECRPIRYLWPYRFATGSLAMMCGDGGIGKSQILLAIAAYVTNGGAWPDESGFAIRGDVVILSAEDRPDDTIRPRLEALGADINRITILQAKITIRQADGTSLVSPASFQNLPYFEEVFKRRPNCRLFIVDPLPSYLGRGVNDSRNTEIRNVLEPLIERIIVPRDICMIGNTHLNKSIDAKTPMHRISGSIAYGALPRNVHFVVRDPENPERRFFKQAKSNNAPDNLGALAFRIEKREISNSQGEVIETTVPVFEAETVAVDLGEAVNGTQRSGKRGPKPTKTTAVAEWLFDLLKENRYPILLAKIIEDAGEAGLIGHKKPDGRWSGTSTLYDAKKLISKLDPPRSGMIVNEYLVPLKERGSAKKHWRLSVDSSANDCNGEGEPLGVKDVSQ